ncbi:PfaD family polyunsaturated fatty acid/polyketide biosynthesis protein [Actinomadura sp. KC216]|uniref:PfaD family polyunsaturated fatty acid/polyketide biosynthesis protein n=1 Tax=Actinomadura sp. KC216 TaxID=2530370 RepID=UPI00104E200F|nr:PfaD family polyunsaturated fatty acid/polyketide biosynthesis protein [Actinomadura sp. KC216]TDB84360.1 PfaD family polyunsaturated fatty acid/polyketide biosynthesis protein [Actinomadura sp. KC216]
MTTPAGTRALRRPETGPAAVERAPSGRARTGPEFTGTGAARLAERCRRSLQIVYSSADAALGVAPREWVATPGYEVVGVLPPLYPEWLGDRSFGTEHATRFAYVAGEMANGIATTRLVARMAEAEMLAFFGAAGLPPDRLEKELDELAGSVGNRPNWGVNLIHQPSSPAAEERVAEILLRRAVPKISASAFLGLTPAVVFAAVSGIRQDAAGRVTRPRAIFAKVSRPEVAEQFMSPAPPEILRLLRGQGRITEREAHLAARVPVAEDVTVEADSAGHTDGRPLQVVLPAVREVRNRCRSRFGYDRPIRVGAAGGLGDPAAVASAYALGADYVLTGSVNQVTAEAGVSGAAKAMLADAGIADVALAPAADMFEMGAKVQVLRRGTMFAGRASRLYEVYRAYDSVEALPAEVRNELHRILGLPVEQVWRSVRRHLSDRDPSRLERAAADPKHRLALVLRWYTARSSDWAADGDPERRTDYQLWCGPAMGAFNQWTAGTFLGSPRTRTVVQVARNLLEGAAVITRLHQIRSYGVAVPSEAFGYRPRELA